MKFFITIILSLTLLACAETISPKRSLLETGEKDGHIVGGTLVQKANAESSSVVMITLDDDQGRSFICTGSFISKNLILTAAHCVTDSVSSMSVLYGLRPFENSDYTTLTIQKIFLPRSEGTSRDDVALIQFSGGLPLGAEILHLPEASSQNTLAEEILALGYGREHGLEQEDTLDPVGAGSLRYVYLKPLALNLNDKHFSVSQVNGQGVCFGDSGGPAIIKNNKSESVIIGVASGVYSDKQVDEMTPGFDSCRQNSLYMKTSSYLSWIKSIQQSLNH